MSRTADVPLRSEPRTIRLVFSILILCLAVHFLVEDTLLYTEFASLRPTGSSAEQVNSFESEHLDDLAVADSNGLPACGMDLTGSAAFAWNTPLIRPALFPIFKPPKV